MTMGTECAPTQFLSSAGSCCKLCPPGTYLVKACTRYKDTVCKKCNRGSYRTESSNKTSCLRCETCDRGQVQVQECTATQGSKCRCKGDSFHNPIRDNCQACRKCEEGYYISRNCSRFQDRECKKCKKNERSDGRVCFSNNITTNAINTVNKETGKKSVNSNPVLYYVLAVALVVLILIVAVVCFLRKRGKKSRYKTTQSLEGITSTYRCEASSAGIDKSVKDLDYEVFSKLASKLNPRSRRNWKDLAGKMGYTLDYIRGLDLERAEATQDLLYDFGTQRQGTVHRLYNMLLEIKRKDAADILLPYLNQSPV